MNIVPILGYPPVENEATNYYRVLNLEGGLMGEGKVVVEK
jgi:hypothetical protein